MNVIRCIRKSTWRSGRLYRRRAVVTRRSCEIVRREIIQSRRKALRTELVKLCDQRASESVIDHRESGTKGALTPDDLIGDSVVVARGVRYSDSRREIEVLRLVPTRLAIHRSIQNVSKLIVRLSIPRNTNRA